MAYAEKRRAKSPFVLFSAHFLRRAELSRALKVNGTDVEGYNAESIEKERTKGLNFTHVRNIQQKCMCVCDQLVTLDLRISLQVISRHTGCAFQLEIKLGTALNFREEFCESFLPLSSLCLIIQGHYV